MLWNESFEENIITLPIDECHIISEWSDATFRSEYANLKTVLSRLPKDVPVLAASATLSKEVVRDVQDKLRKQFNCIQVSNAKLNVRISVCIMQQPQDTFADLIPLFKGPDTTETGPDDFPQTILYVNSRQEAEKIEDFLHAFCPPAIPKVAFKFYHRYIDESEKESIRKDLATGALHAVAATDALGLVCRSFFEFPPSIAHIYHRVSISSLWCASFCGCRPAHSSLSYTECQGTPSQP